MLTGLGVSTRFPPVSCQPRTSIIHRHSQLPEAASLDRTEAVIRRISDLGLNSPAVD